MTHLSSSIEISCLCCGVAPASLEQLSLFLQLSLAGRKHVLLQLHLDIDKSQARDQIQQKIARDQIRPDQIRSDRWRGVAHR